MTGPVDDLLARWRADAAVLRRHGHEGEADRLERLAGEVADALRAWRLERVSIAEAAAESGYSEKALRRMVRDGRLPDDRPDGSRAEIRVPRGALPRKPARERDPASERVRLHLQKARR